MKKKKRNKHKSSASLVAFIVLILAVLSLAIYHLSTSDDSNDNSAVSSDNSYIDSNNSTISVNESDFSSEPNDSASDSTSEISDSTMKPAEEVILYPSDQLDLQLDAPTIAAAYIDGSIIYSKNAQAKCYPASLTKLLTVSTAAKFIPNEYVFTVGDELDLVLEGSSVASLVKGDTLDFLTLVDAVLIPSGNDAAYVMAVGAGRVFAKDDTLSVNDALSVFLSLMNQTAAELGCTNSNFVNPDGYHNEFHYTTASDMLKIAIHSYNLSIIRNSVCQTSARHVYSNNTKDVTWLNTNKLLSMDEQYYYEFAVGMKTGTTDEAGYCLAAVAEKDGEQIVTVIMGASTNETRYTDTISVFNAAYGIS